MIKRLLFWIIFPICWTFLTLLAIFYFDLSNGPLIWFILELVGLAALLILRILWRKKLFLRRLILWAGFIALTITCVGFSNPSVEKKKAYYYDNPIYVETPLNLSGGQVKGVYSEDKKVEIYAGIPYAKAERWKVPEPTSWEGVLDGSYFGPRFQQKWENSVMDSLVDIYSEKGWHPDYKMHPLHEMNENALSLNIWKPSSGNNLPILVYIHGGSLQSGDATFEDYNGESMAHQGVIMITIQYRLGVFGYFAHPDLMEESKASVPSGTTGNYGLLDQIEALKFIKNNAVNFGGDPDQITIAGESAGSSSVSALCSSPLATGLFKRAIGESSSLVMKTPPHTYRTLDAAYENGKKILSEFKCDSIEKLRQISAEKLVNTKNKIGEMTLDGYALTKNPYDVYLAGESNEEALLNGYNVKEADAFSVSQFLLSPTNKKNIKERLMMTIKSEEHVNQIMNLYHDQIEKDAFTAFNDILSIYWFIYPHHSWSRMALNEGKDVYRYQFTKMNGYHETYHSGEMIYCYGNIHLSPRQYAYDESDKVLEKIMLTYWANFAKTGNPNGEGVPEWNKYTSSTDKVQELGSNVGPIDDHYQAMFSIIDDYLGI